VFVANGVKRALLLKSDEEVQDLETLQTYAAYSEEHKYGVFDNQSLLTFVINFPEDDIVSVVTVSGTHGTHVAGITAAHDEDQPLSNGVAPGAQLVSLKIGDTRLGSMETIAAFYRALISMVRLKVRIPYHFTCSTQYVRSISAISLTEKPLVLIIGMQPESQLNIY
jgi:hypothetical protein